MLLLSEIYDILNYTYFFSTNPEETIMAKKTLSQALNQYNESYATSRLNSAEFVLFKDNLKKFNNEMIKAINNDENEEHIKNIINSFLKDALYIDSEYKINTRDNIDSTITRNDKLYVMIETKKPSNKNEMLRIDDINRKALHELILYYLDESRLTNIDKIKRNNDCEVTEPSKSPRTSS